jgi:hypothetical protein
VVVAAVVVVVSAAVVVVVSAAVVVVVSAAVVVVVSAVVVVVVSEVVVVVSSAAAANTGIAARAMMAAILIGRRLLNAPQRAESGWVSEVSVGESVMRSMPNFDPVAMVRARLGRRSRHGTSP